MAFSAPRGSLELEEEPSEEESGREEEETSDEELPPSPKEEEPSVDERMEEEEEAPVLPQERRANRRPRENGSQVFFMFCSCGRARAQAGFFNEKRGKAASVPPSHELRD